MALATSRLSPNRLLGGAMTVDGSLAATHRLVRVSWFGLIVAALAEAAGIVVVATSGNKDTPILDRLTDNWLFVAGLTGLLLSVVMLALIRIWVREANEAFRYTCSLGGFDPVTAADGQMLPDLSERLRHDVGRRLSERISRLTFLAPELADAQAVKGRVPHLHVCGHFLIRENPDGSETLEVVPRARIGTAEAGESLAVPAEIKLEQQIRGTPASGIPLEPDVYERVVERVYFSLATEIYRQIRVDVSRKIDLLPTRRLRATAYLVEAEDYSRSNTLHAYEAAADLFLLAMTLYDSRWATPSSGGTRRAGQRVMRAKTSVRIWIEEHAARVFHRPAKRVVLTARAEIGYADTLLSRRVLAGLSGHRLTPIFLARPVAERAAARLRRVLEEADGVLQARFEAHVVLASAWCALEHNERAADELEQARGVLRLEADEHPGYVLARAATHPRLRSALPLLRRAVELDPRFEVAQFQLARKSELFWRTRSTLEPSVAELAIEEYRHVLRINPSNVRAWTNIGTIHWLLGNPDEAQTAYERARRLKDTVADIYVADVDFGLARIAADRMDIEVAYQHYIHGMAAAISEGYTRLGGDSDSDLLELVSVATVERFRSYHANVVQALDELDKDSEAAPMHRLRQSVRAFVANDLGMAVHSLWTRTGDDRLAAEAEDHYKAARKANADFVLPHYYNALLELFRGAPHKAQRHRSRVDALEPEWREGKLIGCLIDVVRARDLEEEAAEVDHKLAEMRRLGERLSAPLAATAGPQFEAAAPTRVASERDLQPDHTRRLQELVDQHRDEAKALREKASHQIIALFPSRGSDRWPWHDGDFDWRVLEDDRIRRREQNELRWERDFDHALLLALQFWLVGRANAHSLSAEEASRLTVLGGHLLARFHPGDSLLAVKTILAEALNDKAAHAGAVAAVRERHVEALERDPVEVEHLLWLVREAHDLPVEERRTLLEHAASKAEMSESRRLVAEGFWSIGDHRQALGDMRSAAFFEADERRQAVLYAAYQLRAAVHKASIGDRTHGIDELRDLEKCRPRNRSDRWRFETVAGIAKSALANVDPDDPDGLAGGKRGQRTLSLWLGAEQRRVAANPSDDDRHDLAGAQLAAAHVTVAGGLGLRPTAPDKDGEERLLPVVAPIRLICAESLFPNAQHGSEAERMLDVVLPAVRDAVITATGVAPPGVNVELDARLEPGEYRILLDEMPAGGGVAAEAPEQDASEMMGAHLQAVLVAKAWPFFGVDEAAKLVAQLSERGDLDVDLVNQAKRKGWTSSLVLMSGVVQSLLRDGVKVDFMRVVEVVAARGGHDSVGVLSERARFVLRRDIPGTAEPGRLVDLADAFEDAVSDRVERFRGVGALSMSDAELEELLDLMAPHLDDARGQTTVVVRQAGLRPHVHELVTWRWRGVTVLSTDELLDQWWEPTSTVELVAREVGDLAR